nr:hypothetical protein [Streptomyces sp. A0958]
MSLEQTVDKKKLSYGSPSEIRSTDTHLKNLQGAWSAERGPAR